MRKFTKFMLVVAGVFLAVGIGFSAAGAALGATAADMDFSGDLGMGAVKVKNIMFGDNDWDFDWEDDEEDHHNELSGSSSGKGSQSYMAEAVDKVEIDLRYDELILKSHTGENILIEVENDEDGDVKVKSDSKKLEIESKKRKSNRCITVSYPVGRKFSEMDICVGAGSVSVQSELYADKLDVEIGAGEFISEEAVISSQLDIEVGAGSAEFQKVTANKIDGECGIGSLSISLTGQETDYNYKLECGIGDIAIGDEDYSGLAREKKITNSGASGEIDLECGIGEIEIDFE